MMYLFIFEDGSFGRHFTLSDEDKQSADDGYVSIIDYSGTIPMSYYRGEWTEVDAL